MVGLCALKMVEIRQKHDYGVRTVNFHRVIFIIYDVWIRDIEFQLCRYECGEYF